MRMSIHICADGHFNYADGDPNYPNYSSHLLSPPTSLHGGTFSNPHFTPFRSATGHFHNRHNRFQLSQVAKVDIRCSLNMRTHEAFGTSQHTVRTLTHMNKYVRHPWSLALPTVLKFVTWMDFELRIRKIASQQSSHGRKSRSCERRRGPSKIPIAEVCVIVRKASPEEGSKSKSRREEPEGDSGGSILDPALVCNGELNINRGGLVYRYAEWHRLRRFMAVVFGSPRALPARGGWTEQREETVTSGRSVAGRWIPHERYSCLKGVQGKETSMTNARNCPNQ
ncbi:hypothetical protein BD769DRAFT_1389780 [Suillus cothurnatus]|nr:hypothetical protein BD769DRAFT_1394791 [Suillus cothurnatus]KAG2122321.1 hypothetical protein BD769DRAFT_1389780 [Suillus cothurnatus]